MIFYSNLKPFIWTFSISSPLYVMTLNFSSGNTGSGCVYGAIQKSITSHDLCELNAPHDPLLPPETTKGSPGTDTISVVVALTMNPQQLRRRRARIIQDKIQEEDTMKELENIALTGQTKHYTIQTVIVIVTALVVFLGTAFRYGQLDGLYRMMGWSNALYPTFHLATHYPKDVIMERDLPRFFQTYSIVTPDNEIARKAVEKVIRSRTNLKRRAGSVTSILKVWDEMNIQLLLSRGLCGAEFEKAYNVGSDVRKNDLLMWCLLATRIVEGYFMESVEMIDSALFLTRKRGMVVRKLPGSVPGGDALSTSYYLHPRTNNTAVGWIPAKALAWITANPEDRLGTPKEARYLFRRYLNELVITQGNQEDYLVLDEVCLDERPPRAIAIDCPDGEDKDCCYFVLPEKYGGDFDHDSRS
jgi:hypothetical protein